VERGLGSWEGLIEDAKVRRARHGETGRDDVHASSATAASIEGVQPMHLLSAQELHAAHLMPTLIRAESELQDKLDSVQQGNLDTMSKIEAQRAEMQKLVEQLERIVEDVEGAAQVVETDGFRSELGKGGMDIGSTDEDVKMG